MARRYLYGIRSENNNFFTYTFLKNGKIIYSKVLVSGVDDPFAEGRLLECIRRYSFVEEGLLLSFCLLKVFGADKLFSLKTSFVVNQGYTPVLVVSYNDRVDGFVGRFPEMLDDVVIESFNGGDICVLEPSFWMFSLPAPVDIVCENGERYYKLQVRGRYGGFSTPKVCVCDDEYTRRLLEEARRVARKFTGEATFSKLTLSSNWLLNNRFFYRFVDLSSIKTLPSIDVGIILNDKWRRIDVQVDKNKRFTPEALERILIRYAAHFDGFLIRSSRNGFHLVVPTEYSQYIILNLLLEGVIVDRTDIIYEEYFRLPGSKHYKTLDEAKLVYPEDISEII